MPTFSALAGSNDGGGNYTGDTTWPPNGGTFAATNSNWEYCLKQYFPAVSNYDHYWMVMRFDTSSIADGDTVSAAQLELYIKEKYDDAGTFSVVGDYYDYGGNPVVAADWIETPSPSIWSAVDLGSITVDAVNTFTLTDLTGINKTGYTGIRLGISAGTPGTNQSAGVRVVAYDDPTLQEPRLVVSVGAANQTLLPDADLAAGGWTTSPLWSKLNDSSDATIITATAS